MFVARISEWIVCVILVTSTIEFRTARSSYVRQEPPKPSAKIISGTEALSSQFPWFAAVIGQNSTYRQLCGGALIAPEWILTAAHCVTKFDNISISLGSANLSELNLKLISYDYYVHPDYDSELKNADLGLVRLPEPAPFTNFIQTVDLPKRFMSDMTFASDIGVVSGFGRLSEDNENVSQILRYLNVKIIKNSQCFEYYSENIIGPAILCAQSLMPEQNVCAGDSGGPLVVSVDRNFYHIGITAFTSGDCLEAPGGYMRTASYLDWISQVTKIEIES